MINQTTLKKYLTYHPESGAFVWKKKPAPRIIIGAIAGSLNNRGYIHIGIVGERYTAHRLAFLYMTGEFPVDEVDHINRVKTDNRWENLRNADTYINNHNRSNNNKDIGVGWHTKRRKWYVISKSKSRNALFLGLYTTYYAACYARHAHDNNMFNNHKNKSVNRLRIPSTKHNRGNPPMIDKTLKPCPFCGGKAELENQCGRRGKEPVWWAVFCENWKHGTCKCHIGDLDGHEFNSKKEAIKAWNTRTDKHTPLNEAIEKAARELFDNRLGWSEGRNPYAPRKFWGDLSAALYGEDDPRTEAMRDDNPDDERCSCDDPYHTSPNL